MTDLKLFNYQGKQVRTVEKNGETATLGFVRDYESKIRGLIVNGEYVDPYKLLALAYDNKGEFSKKSLQAAKMLMHGLDDPTFDSLYSAVITANTVLDDFGKSEFALHAYFKEHVTEILGEKAKVITRKQSVAHQPDVWIEVDSIQMPVEVKKGKFNHKALSQLLRYIDFYKCTQGVAVGQELTVEAPCNITFVSCRDWLKND